MGTTGHSKDQKPILFFDGVCSLCNSFIDFLFKRDSGQFLYASLQGKTAQASLDIQYWGKNMRSIVLLKEGRVYVKSDAILQIFSELGFPWSLFKMGSLLPRSFRDKIYDWVASHRYSWFGKRETCRLPTPEEKERFLE